MSNEIDIVNNLYYFSGIIADENSETLIDIFNKNFSTLKKIPLFATHVSQKEEFSKINIRTAVNRIIGYITDFNYNVEDKILTIFGFIFENDIDIINDTNKLSLEIIENNDSNILIGVAVTDCPAVTNAEIYHIVKLSYKDVLISSIENMNCFSDQDIESIATYLYNKHINLNTIKNNILNNNEYGDTMAVDQTNVNSNANTADENMTSANESTSTNDNKMQNNAEQNVNQENIIEMKEELSEIKTLLSTLVEKLDIIKMSVEETTAVDTAVDDTNDTSMDDATDIESEMADYIQKYESLLAEYENMKQTYESLSAEHEAIKEKLAEYETTLQEIEQQKLEELNNNYNEILAQINEIYPDFDDTPYVEIDKEKAIAILEDILTTFLQNNQNVDLTIKKFSMEHTKVDSEDEFYRKVKEQCKKFVKQ